RQLGRYDPSSPFVPWLLRVGSNTCINLARMRARRQGGVELGLDEAIETEAVGADPARVALAGEEARRVRSAMASLPPLLRQAVILRVLEDLSFRELAEALGVPLQTAASRVRRALMQVRERLERAEVEVEG